MCLSFCKFSAALYAECMKCVPNDTNITSTGHSRNHRHTHPSAFLTGFALISLVASGAEGGFGPLDPLWPATPLVFSLSIGL